MNCRGRQPPERELKLRCPAQRADIDIGGMRWAGSRISRQAIAVLEFYAIS